ADADRERPREVGGAGAEDRDGRADDRSAAGRVDEPPADEDRAGRAVGRGARRLGRPRPARRPEAGLGDGEEVAGDLDRPDEADLADRDLEVAAPGGDRAVGGGDADQVAVVVDRRAARAPRASRGVGAHEVAAAGAAVLARPAGDQAGARLEAPPAGAAEAE